MRFSELDYEPKFPHMQAVPLWYGVADTAKCIWLWQLCQDVNRFVRGDRGDAPWQGALDNTLREPSIQRPPLRGTMRSAVKSNHSLHEAVISFQTENWEWPKCWIESLFSISCKLPYWCEVVEHGVQVALTRRICQWEEHFTVFIWGIL